MSKAKGIYKRGSVYWIRYAGLDGQVIRESTGSEKFREAMDQLLAKKQLVREGKQPETKRIGRHAFNELAAAYREWAQRQRCYRTKIYLIEQLHQRFANLPLGSFNTKLVELFQTERMEKGNKPATINRLVATLKHMFTKAEEWEMVGEEAAKRIRKVKLLEENNKRLRFLSREECDLLLEKCEPHLRPIVTVALNTGMRKAEILSLKREQVDFRHGFILLDKTKNGERREIPMNGTVRQVLQAQIKRLDIPYIFYDEKTGEPYRECKRSFATACRRAGIKDFRFHDLRHCFASHLVMKGIDITTVKELLGHKTLTMTLRYAHLAPSHKVRAVEVLDDLTIDQSTAQKLHNRGIL